MKTLQTSELVRRGYGEGLGSPPLFYFVLTIIFHCSISFYFVLVVLKPRWAVNPAQNIEIYEKSTKSAIICPKMALKRLKTCEFGRNPDHLPENRKNKRKWKEFVLVRVRQTSKQPKIEMLNFTMRTCVPINAKRLFCLQNNFICEIRIFLTLRLCLPLWSKRD